mmetsp:Transcript_27615/g.75942  ORF Transcript_27615/g.75942 Transcript_27615/m.75942 type:complete len:263 (-) Transcript_27615:2255-3043(-)
MQPQTSGVITCPAAKRMLKVMDSTRCDLLIKLSLERAAWSLRGSTLALPGRSLKSASSSSRNSSSIASSMKAFSARKLSRCTEGFVIRCGRSLTDWESSSSYVVKTSFLETPHQHSSIREQSTTRESFSSGACSSSACGTSPAMTTTEPASRTPASTSWCTFRQDPVMVSTRSLMPCRSLGGGSVGARMITGRKTGWYCARKALTKARTCCQTSPWQTTTTTSSSVSCTLCRSSRTRSTRASSSSSAASDAVMTLRSPRPVT